MPTKYASNINVNVCPASRQSQNAPYLVPKKTILTSPTSIESNNENANIQKNMSPNPSSSNVIKAKAPIKSPVTDVQPEYMNVKP